MQRNKNHKVSPLEILRLEYAKVQVQWNDDSKGFSNYVQQEKSWKKAHLITYGPGYGPYYVALRNIHGMSHLWVLSVSMYKMGS